MIQLIEAFGYRALRDVSQDVDRFQLLVGANASGKSTFLDVVKLIGDLLDQRRDVPDVLRERSPVFEDLVFMQNGSRFELAVEAVQASSPKSVVRYEMTLGLDDHGAIGVIGENLWLKSGTAPPRDERQLRFPALKAGRDSLMIGGTKHPLGCRKVVSKSAAGNDSFKAETGNWTAPFRFGPQRLALANLPEDAERFPQAVWFRRLMQKGIQRLALSGDAMRRPSPPGSPMEFQPDGSNLPWAIEHLRQRNHGRFQAWLDHLRTALPDIETIETIERAEDKHRYLRIHYRTGLKAPSWTVSDGTLRLLALTLVAFLDSPDVVYLIEEPENGIHPQAIEAVFRGLSETFDSQILCATHSPVVLAQAEPRSVLCFARTAEGATDIVRGSRHPNLQEWKHKADLGTLFAAGVLG